MTAEELRAKLAETDPNKEVLYRVGNSYFPIRYVHETEIGYDVSKQSIVLIDYNLPEGEIPPIKEHQ